MKSTIQRTSSSSMYLKPNVQTIEYEGVSYKVHTPYCNSNSRYIIEWDNRNNEFNVEAPSFVSILVRIPSLSPDKKYDILNVYHHMRNYQSERFISKYRPLLEVITPMIELETL